MLRVHPVWSCFFHYCIRRISLRHCPIFFHLHLQQKFVRFSSSSHYTTLNSSIKWIIFGSQKQQILPKKTWSWKKSSSHLPPKKDVFFCGCSLKASSPSHPYQLPQLPQAATPALAELEGELRRLAPGSGRLVVVIWIRGIMVWYSRDNGAYIGISHRGTLVGVHPTILWDIPDTSAGCPFWDGENVTLSKGLLVTSK